MKTKLLRKEELNHDTILRLANELKNGKLIVFPTDTVYGIGTNALDEKACEKVYEAKGRPKHKPLIVLISSISMLDDLIESPTKVERKLIDSFWPGPLTIKFKKQNKSLPKIISAYDDYVRIRLVADGIISQLINIAKVPVVAPSANLSGSPTGVNINNIIDELDQKVDYILDFGTIKNDITSTIVEVIDESIYVIREGKIAKAELAQIAPIRN